MRDLKNYIKRLEINILKDLYNQYKWESDCNIENHSKKIQLIEEELKSRITS